MNVFHAIGLMSLLFSSAEAGAQTLWGGAVAGMSVPQVVSVVRGAHKPEHKPGILADGALALLEVNDVRIANTIFVASFYFKEGSLTQVTLAISNTGLTFDDAMFIWKSLEVTLRSKYGTEISHDYADGEYMDKAVADWIHGKTNINLICMDVANQPHAVLNVNYQVRIAADASNL